ncbi:SpoIID/LytB domain-containing protein [Paenibacillus sp. TH7-28]
MGTRRAMTFSKWGKGIAAALLLTSAVQFPGAAGAAASEQVRVAMYLDLGSTYKSTAPAVTLKAEGAAEAGIMAGGEFEPWLEMGASETSRFSVNGFKVKALESADWGTAAAAVKKLQGTADKPVAYAVDRPGGTVYRIYTGPYASAAEAVTAAGRVAQTLSGQLQVQNPNVRGPYYISAGLFGSQNEAESLASTLNGQDTEAFAVMTGPRKYAVWIGGMSSVAEQASLQAKLALTEPQLFLAPVDMATPALLLHNDVSLAVDAPKRAAHYELYGEGAKLIVRGNKDNSAIKVVERSERRYRGDFEISKVNGQLALVNVLPLEQYLYSVVSAEVPTSWPQEALKAQAVAARSYAMYNAELNKFKIAGLVDTTLSQVYNGVDQEANSVVKAVESTAGEVLEANGKVVEGLFSSNSGGVTADASEVWSNVNPIYASVTSAGDESAGASLKSWYQILLDNGKTGYVREDNAKIAGTNEAGLELLTVTTDNVNVRPLPLIQSDVNPVAKLNPGDKAIVLSKVEESSAYAWIRGPYTSDQLSKSLKGKTTAEAPSAITSLEVAQRGPSGRVTQIKANGQVLDVKYPDSLRSALNGLPSTLFEIVPTGRYTVQGAGEASGTAASDAAVLSASGKTSLSGGNMVVLGADQTARVIDKSNAYLFVGRGNGHGLGLSQWGAKGMADAGYDYREILQHYYQNVTIVKE